MNKILIKSVLFYDHNWSQHARIVQMFADLVRESGVHVILLSDKKSSQTNDNLEVLNIFDVPQKKSLGELQEKYSYSLHKALVPERAFYDYSSFRRSQCYSRLSEEQISEKITPYVNAVDYAIRERADLIIEAFPDNFLSSVAQMIATSYKKPFFVPFPQYWWKDGALIIDRMNMTSTVIDRNYESFYTNPDLLDVNQLKRVFSKPLTTAFTTTKKSKMYTLKDRLQLIINRERSYQPVSLRNWIVRRASTVISSVLIKALIAREYVPRNEPFVIYPLHISPEAAILGTAPELADQFGLIKNISINLPYGVKLYVKQHPYEHLGLGLDYGFYRRLATLPNVRIFDRKAKLDAMLDHPRFLAMALLAGTSALDTVLKRKPVFVFGRTYYSIADCFIKPSDFRDFFNQLVLIMQGKFEFNDRALNAILGALDKSVVRADIDLLAHDNQTDQVAQYPFIWQSYIDFCKQA
jgi:hypothetical protein